MCRCGRRLPTLSTVQAHRCRVCTYQISFSSFPSFAQVCVRETQMGLGWKPRDQGRTTAGKLARADPGLVGECPWLASAFRPQQRPLPRVCMTLTRGYRAHKLYVRTQGLWLLRRARFSSGAGHAVRLDSFSFDLLVVWLISSRYIFRSLHLVSCIICVCRIDIKWWCTAAAPFLLCWLCKA
jgi:hypothetical protein